MDKFSEILDNIKERLTSPLIFSFVTGWVIFNWEISIALIWYDTKEIHAEGCRSIFEFISNKLSEKCTWGWPLFCSILYTFGYPWLKTGIKIFNTYPVKIGIDLENKIFNKLSLEVTELQSELQKESNKSSLFEKEILAMNDVTFLNGHWKHIDHRVMKQIFLFRIAITMKLSTEKGIRNTSSQNLIIIKKQTHTYLSKF